MSMQEERLLLQILKTRSHSWIGYIIRHNDFVVNIIEGALSGEKRPWEDLDYSTQNKSSDTQELKVIQQ
jgi:hypothetical protein